MFNIGDLVKVITTSYYIDGLDDKEWFGETEVGKIGLIVHISKLPESIMYHVSIVEDDGHIQEYYYYGHELEIING